MPRQSSTKSKKIDAKPHVFRKEFHDQPEGGIKNAEDRFQMISEAAYYRALARGFEGGDPVEDWLGAEIEIDSLLPKWADGTPFV